MERNEATSKGEERNREEIMIRVFSPLPANQMRWCSEQILEFYIHASASLREVFDKLRLEPVNMMIGWLRSLKKKLS